MIEAIKQANPADLMCISYIAGLATASFLHILVFMNVFRRKK
jgi:hypothetical protein